MAQKGGKRPGAGRPKGTKNPDTIQKELLKEVLRAHVATQVPAMVDAQIENAKGLKYIVAREKSSGKFVELTEEQAKGIISGKDDKYAFVEVWEKTPNVEAFKSLMNWAIDMPAKPPEQVDMNVSGQANLVEKLSAGRQRVAEARRGK